MSIDLSQERHQLNQSERVRRYVAREFSAAEVTAFECELLQSKPLQADVEAELMLREHAQVLTPGGLTARPIFRSLLTLAASLLLALALGFGAGRFSVTSERGDGSIFLVSGQNASVLAWVQLTQERGSATKFSVPANQVFVARVLTAQDSPHDLTLTDATGQRVRAWVQQQPAPDGFLTLLLPALSPDKQPYRVDVSAPSSQRFELVVK